jgi:hypothetical protein
MAPNGLYESIRGLANKLGEHAARLAGVIALFCDLNSTEISADALVRGIDLAQYYANEALRIREASAINEDLTTAERLLRWLHDGWREETSENTLISLREVYQFGPRPIRDKATALKIVRILEDHGWLVKNDPVQINGHHRRQVWRIVKED